MSKTVHLAGELPELLAALDPQAPLALRHVWLRDVLMWVRGREPHPDPAVARLRMLLQALTDDEALRARWAGWWQRFRLEVDVTPLLADFGFSPRNAFMSELGERLRRKWLPGTPDTTEVIELFMLWFCDARDERWLRRLDGPLLADLAQALTGAHPAPDWQDEVLDAVVFAASQVSAVGFSPDVRMRMTASVDNDQPFKDLLRLVQQYRALARAEGAEASAERAQIRRDLMRCLQACEDAADTVYAHLDTHGISVGIVFRLQQLHGRIARIRTLIDVFRAKDRAAEAWRDLLVSMVQSAQHGRSIRALVGRSTQLTASKVAESTAETGEHYITRTAAEYWTMFARAAGGGAVLALTTWVKLSLIGLGLSVFWKGWWGGVNYALWFVIIQWMHLTVATKHPAMTAPALVAKLRDLDKPHALQAFVDEVGHLFRTQIVAVMGNVGLVVPTVLLLSVGLQLMTGEPMVTQDVATYTLNGLGLWGPSLFFAALTGVLLFASSIVAGWTENAFVFYKIDSALAYHPRITRWLGLARAARWARGLRVQVAVVTANVSLGLMLGLVPAFAQFFGLGLDIRHVTLSAGQVAAAAHAFGNEVWTSGAFWSAVVAVLLTGPINVAVSFYMAFRLALKAQAISDVNRQRIGAALWRRVRNQPLSFVWPPKVSKVAQAASDEAVPDSAAAPQETTPEPGATTRG